MESKRDYYEILGLKRDSGEEEIKKVDPSLLSFMNVNTKKELCKIQQMVKGFSWAEKQEAC